MEGTCLWCAQRLNNVHRKNDPTGKRNARVIKRNVAMQGPTSLYLYEVSSILVASEVAGSSVLDALNTIREAS